MSDQDIEMDAADDEWESLINEANRLYADKRYAQAELLFAAALRLAEKLVSKETLSGEPVDEKERDKLRLRLAKSMNNMAALYHTQGKYTMAEDLWQQCLALKTEMYSDQHLEIAINLHNLAVVCSARRKFEKAEEYYKRALEIRELLLGMHDKELIPILQNYALLLQKMNREVEERQIAERILAIQS
jgi:tetratricopeptide (TPR) repeat protein